MAAKSGTRSTRKPRSTAGRTRASTTKTNKTTKTAAAPTSPRSRRRAPAAQKIAPTVVETRHPVVALPELRKKELVDRVVDQSGAKRKDAKPVVEAVLDILGAALTEGRELNLRPMGKLKISRIDEKSNGTIIACRVRQPKKRDGAVAAPPAHAAE